jgi:hypothetical protein
MLLIEGAKISQQILRQAINDPDFTFGIEAEFYIEGAAGFMQEYMTSGQETVTHNSKMGGIDYEDEYYAKNLRDTTWHDVLHFFKPLGVQQDYRQPPLIMQQRLETFYKENVGREKLGAPSKLWDALKEHLSVPMLMTALQIFPDGRLVGLPENQEKTFRNIVYDGDIEEIKPFGKLGDVQYITDSPEDRDIRGQFHGIRGLSMTQPAFFELVADDLSTKLGTEVISVMDDTKVFHTGAYKSWVVTSDDSLQSRARVTTGIGMVGVELVSPIMSAKEGLTMLDKVLEIMNGEILGLNVFTTAETGLHMNLGVKNKQIDPIKILVLSGDEHIVNKFDRANSEYASSVQGSMRDRMAQVAGGEAPQGMDASMVGTRKDVNALITQAQEVLKGLETDERDIDRVVSVLNNIKPTGKGQSIDFDKLSSGYVEYRAIGNKDYEKRRGEIIDSVLHMIGMTYVATEPSAYRQEFLKKLYLMVQRSVTTADEPITASVGMIGYGPRGGYGAPIENEPKTPYDGEEFLTKYGFDSGSNTQ